MAQNSIEFAYSKGVTHQRHKGLASIEWSCTGGHKPMDDKITILVIEKNEEFLHDMCEILEFEGYEPLKATTGAEGMALANQHHPQLIVCKSIIPDADVGEMVRRLQENSDTKSIDWLFLFTRGETIDPSLMSGIATVLTIPYSAREFIETVKDRLDRQAHRYP
jgi:DNA-binding response OmpR family regulator